MKGEDQVRHYFFALLDLYFDTRNNEVADSDSIAKVKYEYSWGEHK